MNENRTNKFFKDNASFRDPHGYVIHSDDKIYRIIKKNYKEIFEHCKKSGLFQKLIEKKYILDFKESHELEINSDDIYKIYNQEKINFISYPYEWSFDMLKDAALLTLQIQKICIEHGVSLKDASSYNIQFQNGTPIFIDLTSFEFYNEEPWIAYRQFCEHFLGTLALMSKKDVRLSKMLVNYIDGIPLDIVSNLIPKTTFTNFGLTSHIHTHAKIQKKYEEKKIEKKKLKKFQLLGIIQSLESTIKSLKLEQKTEWADYYEDTNYDDESQTKKEELIKQFILKTDSDLVVDFGSNDGKFSEIVSENSHVISVDIDPIAVNNNYKKHRPKILPIIGDLSNPSQGIGWENNERQSFIQRIGKNTCLALALIHHLRITYGIPLKKQFELFSKISKFLIIEFIDKKDSQVIRLLQNREDIFHDYTEKNFLEIISIDFEILQSSRINDTHRTLFLLKNKNN